MRALPAAPSAHEVTTARLLKTKSSEALPQAGQNESKHFWQGRTGCETIGLETRLQPAKPGADLLGLARVQVRSNRTVTGYSSPNRSLKDSQGGKTSKGRDTVQQWQHDGMGV